MKFQLAGESLVKPYKEAVLDEAGVWRDPVFLDKDGKVTDKDMAVSMVLIPPPDSNCRWDVESNMWVQEVNQPPPVTKDVIRIYKYNTVARVDSGIIKEKSFIPVIKE